MMVRLPVSGLEVTLAQLGGAEDILLAEASSCNTRLAVALLARIGRMAEDATGWETLQHGSVSQRLKSPLVLQSPPTRTKSSANIDLTESYWETLAVTDLDFLMLRLRQMVFGDRIAADTRCVAADCGERVEIAFQIEDYLNSYQPDRSTNFQAEDGWLQLDDPAISFRLPTGKDRIVAESHPDPERVLIELCVKPADISAELLDRVQAEIEAISPSLGNILQGNCPECGQAVEVYFDPQLFCLQELRDRAKFIYEDIHLLAMYYRWTEESILNLPRDRRRYYAEMIRQEGR